MFKIDMTDAELIAALPESEMKYCAEHLPDLFSSFRENVLPRLVEGDDFAFGGQNCDDCSGWDGISRRCNCGNRRVEWVNDHGHWYGEAY
jgi:hypothetical protein